MRRTAPAALLTACLAVPAAAQQLGPAGTGGLAALDRTLAHLAANKRVLLIAAHPDDEDTEFLTLLSRGMGVEAAYLALSRGEGGQNLIGPELGEVLGLIRTGELLAAREVDGAHQYFTRAFDFGFSKTVAETRRFWPPDTILADVARVIRRFRPQVLVAVFSGTPRDGHGQHQMAGLAAEEAFRLFQDSTWGPRAFYRLTRFTDTASTTLRLPSAQLDAVAGRSILQLALEGRSRHRSQDMGQLQRLGASQIRLRLAAAAPGVGVAAEGGLFSGVDTTLPPGLGRYAAVIDSARAILGPRTMPAVARLLAEALAELRRHGDAAARADREPRLEEALAAAAGVIVDAASDDGRVAPGETLDVGVGVWSAAGAPVTVRDVAIEAPAGWTVAPRAAATPADPDPIRAGFQATSGVETRRFRVGVPPDAEPTVPYFLARPRAGALYDWSAAPDSLRGEPLDPPLLTARVTLAIAGTAVTLRREVSQRYGDQAVGEVRKPVAVVPAVGVTVDPGLLVWRVDADGARRVTVELVHGARGRTEGEIRLEVPDGWQAVAPQRFVLEGAETRRAFAFDVRAPRGLRPGRYALRAVALAGGEPQDRATMVVDYPHIRPMTWVSRAAVQVSAAAIALPRVRRVGYVRGASDAVPEHLLALGLPLTVLGPEVLERADLSGFDAIVVGSRAYETDPALLANNGRLLDYARAGGRLIVQYQQYPFIQGGYAPYPLTIARPHDRVADETAPVRPLAPANRVFREPNVIGEADWADWVQERGLYFAREWDPAYRPLLETGDNGEALRGGLLAARLGRGLYVYTGLAFFRQLPAGVPGGYRLLLNLIGMEPADVP
jgi:LmbE family N-acetylglucosaminyl deacetylase